MNDGFLDAECVINHWIRTGFIQDSKWKHDSKELYYTEIFLLVGKRATMISIEILVDGGMHKITKSIVRTLERRFVQNFSAVFSLCAI
jgi:hypothetical protein